MIVDLFAGPGGWSEGLRLLQRAGARYSEVGIDNDEAVYLTRQAAGHQTLLADVSALDPAPFAGAVGLIASPPCQLYSAAGSRHGHAALDVLTAATGAVAAGDDVRTMARRDVAQIIAPRVAEDHPEWDVGTLPLDGLPTRADAEADRLAGNAVQVLEPARWIHALQPEWVALEQVPGVLPLWEALAEALGPLGYQCATGIVDAADYGVPQHRRRAVLLAAKGRPVELPAATHGPGRPRPWVTMAEALGWGFVDDAARTVCG
ncbi:MAG TPA: DNA cytosine methyltransferase, partial [Acidimicrobiales bacterium]